MALNALSSEEFDAKVRPERELRYGFNMGIEMLMPPSSHAWTRRPMSGEWASRKIDREGVCWNVYWAYFSRMQVT